MCPTKFNNRSNKGFCVYKQFMWVRADGLIISVVL